MKFVFLFLHLLLLWTCAFAYAQRVSYFSLLDTFYHSDKKCGEWHEICFYLSPFATSVNLCIRLYSGGKLLFLTFIILTKCGEWHEICFLFLHLLLLWTCAFAYAQSVSYFSLLHDFYHSGKKCGEWHEICFHFSLFATFVNLCIRLCSGGKLLFLTFIILTKSVVSDMKFVFLSLHLLLLWTCALAYAQHVSYFAILHNFYPSDKKCGEWHEIFVSLSPFATFVNLCICLCSVGKLLFITHNLSFCQTVWWVTWNLFFSFSTCYFCEIVHSLMLSW